VGCYSPSYHDGDLRCTLSGQCPTDYHCATDKTCWHNGRDPAAQEPGDGGSPDASSSIEDGGQGELDVGFLDDGGRVIVPLDQFASYCAIVVCKKDFECCTQADLKGNSLANCESNIVSQLQSGVQAVSDGIDRGRTVYNPDRAYQCLVAIATVGCPSWPIGTEDGLPAGCGAMVSPRVPSGGACRSAVECTTDFCSGATSNADGTCLPRAASGQNCTQVLLQNSCEDGLFCDSTNLCSATEPEGSACTLARNCASRTCSAATNADAGNVCVPAACYSSGPLLPPGCSMGGRPASLAGVVLLVVAMVCLRRRRSASR
jgi:hypothetical protein